MAPNPVGQGVQDQNESLVDRFTRGLVDPDSCKARNRDVSSTVFRFAVLLSATHRHGRCAPYLPVAVSSQTPPEEELCVTGRVQKVCQICNI
jgi:hypothetical protein